LGLTVLPTFIASDAIRSGAVVPVLLDYPMPTRALYVVRPPGAYVPGKVRVLIDLLVERFGGTPYWDPCQMEAHQRGLKLDEPLGEQLTPATGPAHQAA
jgi:hypothetical protein